MPQPTHGGEWQAGLRLVKPTPRRGRLPHWAYCPQTCPRWWTVFRRVSLRHRGRVSPKWLIREDKAPVKCLWHGICTCRKMEEKDIVTEEDSRSRRFPMKKLVLISLLLVAMAPTAQAFFSINVGWGWDWDWQLSGHGRWVYEHDVGRVWVPRVTMSWQPYMQGHWAWSDWGWMWVSYEPWHATYHYGRWLWTDYHGWVWVPGHVWGPSWVVWTTGPGYMGWAPMPPDWYHYRYPHYWQHYHRHYRRWVFVDSGRFLSHSIYKYKFAGHRVKRVLNSSYAPDRDGKVKFSKAPEKRMVERATGKRVEVISKDRVKTYEGERLQSRDKTPTREKERRYDHRERDDGAVPVERETRSDRSDKRQVGEERQQSSDPSSRERSGTQGKETRQGHSARDTRSSEPAEERNRQRVEAPQQRDGQQRSNERSPSGESRSRERRPYYQPSDGSRQRAASSHSREGWSSGRSSRSRRK